LSDRHGSASISPTAHYTGQVWARNGLSHPELASIEGRVLFEALRPGMTLSGVLGGPTLEPYLLARHRAIDALLERAIERDGVTQVIEVACGLSPRGWRFSERYGDRITYVEADLPAMAERKRAALEKMGSLGEHHRVEVVDALHDEGAHSLAALTATLDRSAGLAIITEGLTGYLDTDTLRGIWQRFARELAPFPVGAYFSDIPLGSAASLWVRAGRFALGAFVRGRVHLHFGDAADAVAALQDAGFARAVVEAADEAGLAHIIDARRS
jgi:O-methyltransferase involved in polyketide biosynthesis